MGLGIFSKIKVLTQFDTFLNLGGLGYSLPFRLKSVKISLAAIAKTVIPRIPSAENRFGQFRANHITISSMGVCSADGSI